MMTVPLSLEELSERYRLPEYVPNRALDKFYPVEVSSGYVAYDAHEWCRKNLGSMIYKPPSFLRFVFIETFSKEAPALQGLDYRKTQWVYDYYNNPVRFYFKNPADAVWFKITWGDK